MLTAESEYFKRQFAISEIGAKGIEKLRASRVVIVGVGGVGSAAADYLARSGVGYLRLVDQDIVEPSNLHRLPGVGRDYLYHPKAEAVSNALSKSHPWVRIDTVVDTLRSANVDDIMNGVDIILDGLDNFRTRYLVNRFASETGTPYVFASAIAQQGHVGVFNPPKTPCLECVIPRADDDSSENCETVGITPATTGLVGAVTATEAMKHLLDLPTALRGRLLTIDLAGPEFLMTETRWREECGTCGKSVHLDDGSRGASTMLCGQNAAVVLPDFTLDVNLESISRGVSPSDLLSVSELVLVYRAAELVISVFRNGRVLISGVNEEESALKIARDVWKQGVADSLNRGSLP